MKTLVTIIITVFICQMAYSQGISVGLRSGVGTVPMDIKETKTSNLRPTWDKQLFARYETKKRFAFELSGTQYKYNQAGTWTYGCFSEYNRLYFDSPNKVNLLTEYNYNVLDINFDAQYDISSVALANKCPILKNFKSYLGVRVTGTIVKQNVTYTDQRLTDGQITESEYYNTNFADFSLGLNHSINYYFKHIYLTSTVNYQLSISGFKGYVDPTWHTNNRASMLIGVGYRF